MPRHLRPSLVSPILALALAACGSHAPPATTVAPTTTDAGVPQPMLGGPCSPEGATSGADACQKTSGFCNVMSCENGHWAGHEVPPRLAPSPHG